MVSNICTASSHIFLCVFLFFQQHICDRNLSTICILDIFCWGRHQLRKIKADCGGLSPSSTQGSCRARDEKIYEALHLLRVAFSSTFCTSSDLFFLYICLKSYKKDAVIAATCSSWHGLVLWLFFSETGGRWWLQYCRVILMWKADFCSLWGVEHLASVDPQASHFPSRSFKEIWYN